MTSSVRSVFRPLLPGAWSLLLLLTLLPTWSDGELHAQTMVGTIAELRSDGTVRLDLLPGSAARAGILAFVVRYDDEVAEWFPLAEIAIESAGGGMALGRILELGDDAAIRPGDQVAIYEAVRDDEVSLRVTPPQLELLMGETANLEAELVDGEGQFLQTVGARWRSSNEEIATVSDDGRVIAISMGEALVIGQGSGGVIAAATVRVVEPNLVIPDSIVAFVGVEEPVQIEVSAQTPRPVAARSFRWSIDDPGIATIDAFGVIRPQRPGFTQIRFAGLNREGLIPVRVLGVPSDVLFSPRGEEIEIVQGEAVRLSASVRMADGAILEGFTPRITQASELVLDTEVPGEIRGRRVGEARVESAFGGLTHSWSVRVSPPAIDLDLPGGPLLVGQSVPLQASLRGSDGAALGAATDVLWSVEDPGVARVEGLSLVPVGFGRTRVEAVLGEARAEREVLVLGDLLMTLRENGEEGIVTLSLASGEMVRLPDLEGPASQPALSPDGRTLAFVQPGEGAAGVPRVMIAPIDNPGDRREITGEAGGAGSSRNLLFHEHRPAWSHDGRTLFLLSNRTGSYAVYALDTADPRLRRLTRGSHFHRALDPAPDAPVLAVARAAGSGGGEVVLMLSDGSDPQVLLGSSSGARPDWGYGNPRLFLDGTEGLVSRWSTSDRRRGHELVLVEFGDSEGQHRMRTLVPPVRDHELLFAPSPDGERIVYASTPTLGGETGTIVLIDRDGRVLQSVRLPPGAEVLDLSWTRGESSP